MGAAALGFTVDVREHELGAGILNLRGRPCLDDGGAAAVFGEGAVGVSVNGADDPGYAGVLERRRVHLVVLDEIETDVPQRVLLNAKDASLNEWCDHAGESSVERAAIIFFCA